MIRRLLRATVASLLILFTGLTSARAAVAYVTGSNVIGSFAASTSFSNAIAFTLVGGSTHVLVVTLHFSGNPGAFTSVTYNSVAMTQFGTTVVNGTSATAVFYLVNPAAGNQTLAASWTNSVISGWIGAEFSGINTSTPLANFNPATGTSSTPAVTATTVNGDAAYAAFTTATAANYSSSTQTNIVNGSMNGATNNIGANYGLASGSSVAFSWTNFSSAAWNAVTVDIQQAAAGSGPPLRTLTGSGL